MGGDTTSMTDYAEQFSETNFISPGAASSGDIFSMLEVLEGGSDEFTSMSPLVSQKSNSSCSGLQELVDQAERQKISLAEDQGGVNSDGGQPKVTHITVERNRRKQMNEHLTVLRSLMPCFYVKRGDQASIIGGVVDYITELQQVLQSLEAKKQRKVYSDVLSPRNSPRKPPISPRPPIPISPRTPQSISRPYRARGLQQSSMLLPSVDLSPSSSNSSTCHDIVNELVANSKSSVADVEVKFSGSNLVLKTVSPRLPGQTTKIVSVLEGLSLDILQAGINTVDETMVNSFTIKIGIECQLSAEDLVQHIQHTFC